jgi:hypothetical protein
MRVRPALVIAVVGCGGQITAPPIVVPTTTTTEALELDPSAPYARLFANDARWEFRAATWLGAGPAPTVTCAVESARSFERARVGYLHCAADRDLGPLTAALPRFGLIATDHGLWFTEHLTTVTALPDDEAAALAWTASEPMRLGAKPAPLVFSAHADAADGVPAVDGRVEAFGFGDGGWCTAIENAAAGDSGRVVLCFAAGRGLIGGGAALASRGIVTGALTFGEAPPPPASARIATELDVDVETVSLTDAGKGKRAPLTLTAVADRTQPLAYQIAAHAISDDGDGAPAEADQPTLVLRGTAVVTAVEPSGRFRYDFTVAEATATGPGTTPALTTGMATLVGGVFSAAVDPDGRVAARRVEVAHPIAATPVVIGQVAQSMDTFVALPAEPIAVGATWTSTYPTHIVGQEVVVTVRSKLVSRKGAIAVVSSETAIAPIVQPVAGGTARFEATGTITTVFTAGLLLPTRAAELRLIATVAPTPGVANPARKERHELHMRTRVLPK